MEARARAIAEQRQRDKSPGPANRHRRDKSTDGSVGRFPVVASPRPDHGRSVSGVGLPSAKRSSLEVPGSADGSPIQVRNQSAVDKNSATKVESTSATTNGQGQSSPDIMTMPGTFSGGGPGPHIPPPLDDDSQESDTPAPPPKEQDPSSKVGSLKRSAAASERKPVGRVGPGSLRSRLNHGGLDETSQSSAHQGVQLSDKAMDDFS